MSRIHRFLAAPSLSCLLLLPQLAAAIPLRERATLEYRVWRGKEADSCLVRLSVLDKTQSQAGTLWKVAVLDSLLDGLRIRHDTATLWRTDTNLIWEKPSPLAAIEAWSRDSIPWRWRYSDPAYTRRKPREVWGYVGIAANLPSDETISIYRADYSRCWLTDSSDNGLKCIPFPRGAWIAGTGWGRVADLYTEESWTLWKADGVLLDPSTLPSSRLAHEGKPGTVQVWRIDGMNSYGGNGLLRWEFLETLPDSASFRRWRIHQTFQGDDNKVQDTTVTATASPLLDLAFPVSPPAQAMLILWSDATEDNQEFTRTSFYKSYSMFGVPMYILDTTLCIRPGTGMNSAVTNYGTKYGTVKTTYRLISFDTTSISTNAIPKRELQGQALSLPWLRRAMQTPAARLIAHRLDGRAVEIDAQRWEASLRAFHGPVLLELRSAEGVQRGMYLSLP